MHLLLTLPIATKVSPFTVSSQEKPLGKAVTKLIEEFFSFLLKISNYFNRLTPEQQALLSTGILLIFIVIFAVIMVVLVAVFDRNQRATAADYARLHDQEIRNQVAARKRQLADAEKARNHQPFKLKFIELLYQVFR